MHACWNYACANQSRRSKSLHLVIFSGYKPRRLYFCYKMAGASSKASYLNTESAEASTHPKIEPEIEVVEATRDSDEVCSLEKKECDDIMEHLKNNPGLVVKSLGPEGQIVLHVAVMADETKKPKPPASKCTNKGFSQAADDSDWYRALEWQDCKALMSLLQANPCLVAQTGPKGWTVLHAAVDKGCISLLVQVLNLFDDKCNFVNEMSGVKVNLHDLVTARCGTFQAEAYDMAYFTCPRHVWMGLLMLLFGGDYVSEGLSWAQSSSSNAPHPLRDKIIEIMLEEPSKKAFEFLKEQYQQDGNYNFVLEHKELQFHYACQQFWYKEARDYVRTIIGRCLELGPSESVEVLTYLFQLHNAQGQTPFHVASSYGCTTDLLELVPPGDAYKECLNAKDVRGWTILHFVTATKLHKDLKALLNDKRIDVNARTTEYIWKDPIGVGMTALHLAILYNDVESVKLLLKCPRTDVNALFHRYIVCGYEKIRPGDDEDIEERRSYWSPLQLATIMGLLDVVRALLELKLDDIYDDGKLHNNSIAKEHFRGVSALLLASAAGNPDILRLFLNNPIFDSLVKFEGATALHYATNAMIPMAKMRNANSKVGRFLQFSDLRYLDLDTCRYEEELEDIKLTPTSYLGREACITMLLQAGVDIWEKDNQGRFAEPGPQAPEEALLWWHEKMARETLEAKMSLNNAANAISVVAALVATASFVGPLQPPLGYGGDSMEGGVQDTHLSIRVFMVSNILSFYLAVASIMFAVVPSLPMPQEGIYAEWQRTRRTVGVAIFFLLMSVLGVLISFGAASNSVVSEYYSWQHVGLSFYPTLLGGFICILGISLFFLRLLRLVFNKNAKIRYLYKNFVKL